MYALLVDGEYDLSPTAAALLWFMLYSTFYYPGHSLYLHVNPAVASRSALSKATRRSEASVKRGLAELEELGFIVRTQQFGANGYQRTNAIKMSAPNDFCWAHRRRGHRRDARCREDCMR